MSGKVSGTDENEEPPETKRGFPEGMRRCDDTLGSLSVFAADASSSCSAGNDTIDEVELPC